ncbi:alpha/beta-hydrolase [Rickenella mellea]|uniref:Alpha/beta-hydrolase n=1 Tax=Rickenella mellea TaxID=50990 RepID=A0A4Y7QLA5_9AGAM|nr:alpha/beta-hydrolase [Rickenella mellea]
MLFQKTPLSEAQWKLYNLEGEHNFRWVHLLGCATKSPYKLSSANFAPAEVVHEISEAGQFAEFVDTSISPKLLWNNLELLCRPKFPLEEYNAIKGATLVSAFRDTAAGLPGSVVYRPDKKQLVVAFSGTGNNTQALHDLDARLVNYPYATNGASCKVHAGFLRMYNGARESAFAGLRKGLKEYETREIMVTGHSLGGALSFLFVTELLANRGMHGNAEDLLKDISVKLFTFGAPRTGNNLMVGFYKETVHKIRKERGEDCFQDYSVRGHNDGVPSLPPKIFGFRHFPVANLFFLHHGCLYKVPSTEIECSDFHVDHDEEGYLPASVLHPRGGHNYYNVRDMERLGRMMHWIDSDPETGQLKEGWEKVYLDKLAEELGKKAEEGRIC